MMRSQAELIGAAMENQGEMMPPVTVARDTDKKEQLLLAAAVEEEEAATAATAAAIPTGGDEGSVQWRRIRPDRRSEQYVTRSFTRSNIAHQSS